MTENSTSKGFKIAVINYEPVSTYKNQGWSAERLGKYYNPANVAQEVCVFAHGDEDWQVSPSVRVMGYKSFGDLEKNCRIFNPDIVRCYEAFRPNCDYALLLAMKLGVPSFLSVHDNRVQYPQIISEFTIIAGCSENVAERAAKILHRDVETILYADIDPNVFKPKIPTSIDPRVASAKYRIFTIMRKDPVKNVDTVIEATRIVADKLGSVAHALAGPGSEEIPFDGIHLGLGSTRQEMLAEYMNWSNCFLQVQYIPEISHAPAEAMVVGRPVIITGDPEGIAHYVIDESRGILIPMEKVGNAAYIAEKIQECLRRKYDYEAIRKWAIERYDADRLAKKDAERFQRLYQMKSNVKYSFLAKLKLLRIVRKTKSS